MRTLIIAAHPDDEVLGCGGTIARLTRTGVEVYTAILGEGSTSRYPQREHADPKLVESLQGCSQQVADYLGVQELFCYGLPDNRFDTVPLLEIVKTIEEVITRLQPEVIYTHHSGDLNIDHAILARAVLTATRPVSGCRVKEVYAFEVPSSTDWALQRIEPIFRPNVFIDISETLETKIRALQFYDGELRPFPHPRSPEALRAVATRWGSVCGLPAAEAHELIRAIRG